MEPVKMRVDFCRHTSDSFRLPDALGKLSDAYAEAGDYTRAEELIQELIDKNKDDERLVERLHQLRARSNGGVAPPAKTMSAEVAAASAAAAMAEEDEPTALGESSPAPAGVAEEALDEETQKYISQALTDVDLFSSYGLTQKATHLLESALQRAPRHTPALERIFALLVGLGNERRAAELAAALEALHRGRGDRAGIDRFSELRRRFSANAGVSE